RSGRQADFSDDDHLWADTLDVNVKKLNDEDREKLEKEVRKQFEADIADTEAYIEDAGERMRQVWELFQTMDQKQVVADETLFRELKDRFGSPFGFGEYFRGGMGAEAVRDLLQQVDLDAEREKLEDQVKTAKGQKQSRAVKRLKVVSAFIHSDNRPEDMVLEAVPVIPPELRPMVQLDGGRFATSDLNDLYRRVINRNNRLKRLLDLGAPEIIVNNEKRMLQEAVDALFDNGRRGRPVTGPGNRPLKSLSDMLKGKQGRFRQNLLGKRVDYSGRSVIVAGPELKIHQAGLPKLMALELFKPFIMARLVERKSVQNIKAAKKMVDSMIPEVWDVLEEVIQEHPVLLNRAPTLHRLGLQAFEPVLVEGKAIQVHPLVCHAFNADFDGDQMAVHVPLSAEAQAEARILMLSANNILSPAHGSPLATPTQDMVLGGYYLTYGPGEGKLQEDEQILFEGRWEEAQHGPRPHVFRSAQEAELSYESGKVRLHDLAEYRRRHHGDHVLTTVGRIMFNERVERALEDALGEEYDPSSYEFVNRPLKKKDMGAVIERLVRVHGPYATALVLDAFKELGFHFATQAGITISKNDVVVPPRKEEILDRFEAEVGEVQDQYDTGLITQEERHEAVVERWTAATDEVGQAMQDNLGELNPIFMMANSGARGSFKQIRQLAGMRGLMANPKGEIIERPIKANFMEGLTVLEYFISTHGARKGLADTALRTADSGYLTRRLVDVAQDVIVREEDCGTGEYVEMDLRTEDGSFNGNVEGRFAALDIATKRGRVLAEKGTLISGELVAEIREALGDEPDVKVPVRSVLKCEAEAGVCQACYGRAPATGKLVAIGDAVGIIAAQSIGEPGTQLTLRTFHTGGVAGLDITQGLPRVVELFEARKPKGLAQLSPAGGVVSLEYTEKALRVILADDEGQEQAFSFPRRTRLLVEQGQHIERGAQLNEGSIYPHEMLEVRGRTETEVYLVREVQRVYKSQGVDIDDKHIEIIVRQMMKKVRVDQKGDTTYLPGQFVDRNEMLRVNAELRANGSEEAQLEEIILGITKASLATDSFLSAASFQETTKVLTDAALEGKTDRLLGLKENVIIGKLIPAATGLRRYRRLEIEPTEPIRRPADELGLLEESDIAAELGLTDGGEIEGFGLGDAGDFGELADLPTDGDGDGVG
ncbi:MAG: DNA-directed RNA polymerase subunit beta', partial [Nocardioidaceae bacterium]